MTLSKDELTSRMLDDRYPRSNNYDQAWVFENLMGPNVLWLTEALTQKIELKSGMRILDLGCGKALSSIFLAKEFDVEVWATDLWINATDNFERICTAGLQRQVFPIHAEAHSLPFAEHFFDAVVSLDAYHYFGTDDLYLGYHLSRLIKPGGTLGMIVPGLVEEFSAGVPEVLQAHWNWEFSSFHSAAWWRNHWLASGMVTIECVDLIPEGWKDWLRWLELCRDHEAPFDPSELSLIQFDQGRNLGFVRMVATNH